jgi:hypothetical protein
MRHDHTGTDVPASTPCSPGGGRRRPTLACLLVAAVMLAALGVTGGVAPPAGATHFRANQITWERTGPTTAEFHLTGSWRMSFFFWSAPSPGATFSPACIDFGDGSGQECPTFTVTSADAANDVVSGEATVSHTYATTGPFVASMANCCRLSGPQHVNNPDGSVRFEALVDLAATSASPVSLVSPIVDCPVDAVCQFTVPAHDPDGQALRWRLATDVEAGGFSGGFAQPGPPHATNAAAVDPASGLYSWDTTGATLNTSGGDTFYSTQVVVENVVGSGVVSRIPVDFFIRLSTSPNQAPVFTSPTPADGTVINASVGAPVTFGTAATDPDSGDTVTLAVLGAPAGATHTTTPANPATGSFSWTPSATGTVLLTLTARDQHGLGATQRSVTIVVSQPQAPTSVAYTGGASVQYSDPVTVSGRLVDASVVPNAPLAGKTLGFMLGSQAASAGPTDANGDASTALTVTQQPGSATTVGTSFAGDAAHLASADGDPFSITREDCTIDYTGDTLVAPLANTTLAAQLGEPDTSLGDLTGKAVTFTLTSSSGAVATHTAVTGATGAASTSVPLPADVYGVVAGFAGDDWYTGCASPAAPADTLVTVQAAAAKVTGGGWFTSSTAYRTSFGLNLVPQAGGLFKGQLQLRTNNGKGRFHGDTANAVVTLAANKVSWKGTGKWQGAPGYTFEVTVVDNGSSGSKKGDTIAVKVYQTSNPGNVVYTSGGDKPLKGGNLTVH